MLSILSLFAGCGGSSMGYQMAGCKVLAAIEHEPHAATIYRYNFPETQLLETDITTLDTAQLLQQLNLSVGELDILDGSPPCQGFSMAGKRILNDPRNRLFEEYVRFLSSFQPRAFVMENVPGLINGKMISVFHEIIQTLSNTGYVVRARVLNAAHYNVPQSRHRVIIIGFRRDLNLIPLHPKPTSLPISFRQATQNLRHPGLTSQPKGKALHIAKALLPGQSGADLHKQYRQKGNDFSLYRIDWDKPAPTVCKTIRLGQCGLIHPGEERFLGVDELKRVCSFPDEFRLTGTFEQQWARLGNAVPPLLMSAVATSIINQLEGG